MPPRAAQEPRKVSLIRQYALGTILSHNAHEAREGDDAGSMTFDSRSQFGVEGFPRQESAMLDDLGGDAPGAREIESCGIGKVADDSTHPQPGLDNGPQVAAAPRNQDDDRFHGAIVEGSDTQARSNSSTSASSAFSSTISRTSVALS